MNQQIIQKIVPAAIEQDIVTFKESFERILLNKIEQKCNRVRKQAICSMGLKQRDVEDEQQSKRDEVQSDCCSDDPDNCECQHKDKDDDQACCDDQKCDCDDQESQEGQQCQGDQCQEKSDDCQDCDDEKDEQKLNERRMCKSGRKSRRKFNLKSNIA